MKVVNVEKGKVLPDVMMGKNVFAYDKHIGRFLKLKEHPIGEILQMLETEGFMFFKIVEGDE